MTFLLLILLYSLRLQPLYFNLPELRLSRLLLRPFLINPHHYSISSWCCGGGCNWKCESCDCCCLLGGASSWARRCVVARPCESGRRRKMSMGRDVLWQGAGGRVHVPSDGWRGLEKDAAVHGRGCRACRRRCHRRLVPGCGLGGGLGGAGCWTEAALQLRSIGRSPCLLFAWP